MGKELVITSDRHETKVAILEDGQLVEVYFQRANEYSLAGSIHKGRVTRVLPGMQSAFVDLGLERDTFLYVSDFFEDQGEDEIEKVAEDRRPRQALPRREPAPEPAPALKAREEAPAVEPEEPAEGPVAATDSPSAGREDRRFDDRGGRRRRRRRGGNGRFPESKFASAAGNGDEDPVDSPAESAVADDSLEEPILLPGESLAKYRRGSGSAPARAESRTSRGELADPADSDAGAGASESMGAESEAVAQIVQQLVDEEPSVARAEEEAPQLVAPVPEPDAPIHHPVVHEGELAAEALIEEPGTDDDESADEDETEAPEAASGDDQSEDAGDDEPAMADAEMDDAEIDDAETETVDARAELLDEIDSVDDAGLPPALESIADGDAPSSGDATDAPLGPMGFSAHLREQPGRFLQQRSDRPERGGRRRRRGGRGGERGDRPERSAEGRPPAAEGRTPADARPDARSERPERSDRFERGPQPLITDLLKEGQEILVQIAKEPLGQKGARITSHIALPGRYCVYMPTVEHTGVSRKIASDEERQRLKRILVTHKTGIPGGFIIRTAGEGKSEADIAADISYLYNLWLDIRQKAEKRKAPALIYHDLDIVERLLRDQLSEEFKAIWCDAEEMYESVLAFVQRMQPSLVARVKMYTRPAPIFDAFSITAELEKALRPKVWLKSGGYIVINQTEALVAIDINTGKYIGKSNRLEDTIVRTNIEAVKEIVRQVRLRDLGGIIVIDFIDMDERKNRQKVMQALEEAMRLDRAPYKILQFNDFGLVAITRKRVKQSLERTLCQPCPYCEGAGYVRSVQTVITEILAEAKKIAAAVDGKECVLRANPEVAKVLKSTQNTYLEELEQILKRPVAVIPDPTIHHEKFDLS